MKRFVCPQNPIREKVSVSGKGQFGLGAKISHPVETVPITVSFGFFDTNAYAPNSAISFFVGNTAKCSQSCAARLSAKEEG